jgi:hypothetical protein
VEVFRVRAQHYALSRYSTWSPQFTRKIHWKDAALFFLEK